MSTSETDANESKALAKIDYGRENGLDEYVSTACLTRTLGETMLARENAANARTFFVADLIFKGIFEKDIEIIDTIAKRIDGTVPTSKERESFANLMGDAIEDVLDMTSGEQTTIQKDDPVIIALAKMVFHIATCDSHGNAATKKERKKAIEMVFERTSGRRTEPVRPVLEEKFVEPDWMALADKVQKEEQEQIYEQDE